MQSHSNEPLTQPPDVQAVQISSEQLIKDWQPAVGVEDVAALEFLLDESLTHLGNILKLLPARYNQAEDAREFLAQFRQPV